METVADLRADQREFHTGSVETRVNNVHQGAGGKYATGGQRKGRRRRKGGRPLQKKRVRRGNRRVELVDMVEKRNLDVLCVQETK